MVYPLVIYQFAIENVKTIILIHFSRQFCMISTGHRRFPEVFDTSPGPFAHPQVAKYVEILPTIKQREGLIILI